MGGFGGGSLFGSDATGGGGLDLASLASSTFGGGGGGGSFNNFGAGSDPLTAALFGGDPTGSLNAQAALTGNYGGDGGMSSPAGPPDLGGVQSGSDGSAAPGMPSTTPAATPQAPAAPATTPAPVPPTVAAADTSTGPFSPSQQPNVPGPTGFTPLPSQSQVTQGLQMLQQGQGTPTSNWQQQGSPNQQVANRWGAFQPPSGGAAPQQMPQWMTDTAGNLVQTGGHIPAYDQPDDGSQTAKPPAASADTTPPTPGDTAPPPRTAQTGAPGLGGLPGVGGIGKLIGDLMGIMSGNPQSLQGLVGDVMRMAGSRQMPGYGTPFMQPNAGQMFTQGGDPSTFGGGYAGMVPGGGGSAPWLARGQRAPRGTNPMNYPQAPPGARFVPGRGIVNAQGATVSPTSGQPPPQVAAAPPGSAPAPSKKADGSFPTGRREIAPIVSDTLRQSGMSNNGIRGIMYNIGQESSFDPTMRHADQPKFGGEAHYAHGLYQEGGDGWNSYSRWLNGRGDWRDPKLQTQFLARNIQQNYPGLWNRLQNARSPEEAAVTFAAEYLKPSRANLIQRISRIRRGDMSSGRPDTQSAEELAYE